MINEERMSVYVRSATSHLTIPFHLTDYVAVGRFDSASDCSTRA
jgi:hypothetical protein